MQFCQTIRHSNVQALSQTKSVNFKAELTSIINKTFHHIADFHQNEKNIVFVFIITDSGGKSSFPLKLFLFVGTKLGSVCFTFM